MHRFTALLALAVLAAALIPVGPALGQTEARVRVAHLSPDAPAVDVWVDGELAFDGVAFEQVTDYVVLPAGSRDIVVVPAGATEPEVISAAVELLPGADHTVAAVGLLADIAPLVLQDDNGLPESGQAHLRFVHAAPDAPAVDVALAGGPKVFEGLAFGEVGAYVPLPADVVDVELRAAGEVAAVLTYPGLWLRDGGVYTVFATGLLAGDPELNMVVSADMVPARLRVAHASPDAPNVDVWIDDAVALADVGFADVTEYAALAPGVYAVKVTPSGAAEPVVLETSVTLTEGSDYTALAGGLLQDIDLVLFQDDAGVPAPGTAHVRFVHASPDAPAVDVAVKDGPVLLGDVAFGEATEYVAAPAGTYDLEVRPTGTITAALELPDVALAAGSVYSFFAMGLVAGDPALRAVVVVDAASTLPEPPSGEARLRLAHASPDAPAVDVWLDGEVAFAGLAYGQVTDYALVAAGRHSVKVVPAGAEEPVVIEAQLELEDGADYTASATGLLEDIAPLLLMDDNSLPEAGRAHVRFVHLSPDAPAVDVAVKGGPVLWSAVGFGEVGAYAAVDAGVYDLEVRATGGAAAALEVPGVLVRDGAVYTVFAMGLLAGDPPLAAVLTADVNPARLRAAHLSPDAPAVDVLIDGMPVLTDLAFGEVSAYAPLAAGMVSVMVVASEDPDVVVLEADLELGAGMDYTVAAIGLLEELEPLVLQDDNRVPAPGMAHVRFVHAVPDAPAVDIAAQDGPVLFGDVSFGLASDYVPLEEGTYVLEVRPAGDETALMELPAVEVPAGAVITVFAVGLFEGEPAIEVLIVVDAAYDVVVERGYAVYLPFLVNRHAVMR